MKKFALIGHPVAGSLSPVLIKAAYQGRYTYDLVDREHFEEAWDVFVQEYDGINVTAPFKQDAFAKVDFLDPQAQATGAVNLVIPRSGGYAGYNTDVDGVLVALRETGLSFADALVVGNGGAARAAVYAARALGCTVTVCGRSVEEYRIPQLSAGDCRLYVSGRRWMLGQAVAGYRLFTGEEPDVQEMLRAL